MKIPSTQELTEQHLAYLEGSIAQTSPLHDKAFLRVLAVLLGMAHTGIYKFAADRVLQNLVLTASGDDLDRLGADPLVGGGVIRKLAAVPVLIVSLDAQDGITVPVTASFVGDLNGVRYTMNGSAVAADDEAVFSVTAEEAGVAGNLQPADTLSIVSAVPGASVRARVISADVVGADDEKDDAYRLRILAEMRRTKGGGNPSDYKSWAEAVPGVARAFPYAGKPTGTDYPGDRTVYIEADTSLDPDGIPVESLLDAVREALNTDPATGLGRPALGLVDTTLYVEPVVRTSFNVEITNLQAPDGTEAAVRANISSALALFFPMFAPYVEGVDLPHDRNDRITTPALSTALQDVLLTAGASAASVTFSVDGDPYNAYQLSAGELCKLGVISYVIA